MGGSLANPPIQVGFIEDTSSDIHSWVAVAMFGISAIAVGIARKRGKLTAERAWWIPLALIPVAVLLMQVPVSEPLYNKAPSY